MNQDLIYEIGVEELPSAYVPGAIEDFKRLSRQMFTDARLSFDNIEVYGTPRRLTLHVTGLGDLQEDALIENRGPKKSMAYDENGNPTKACQGFARGQGVAVDALEIRPVGEIEYVFAIKKEKGKPALEVVPEILTQITHGIGFPKSMRWGYYHFRFARPIRWILALMGEQLLDIELENIKSSPYTYGHRFLSCGPLRVKSPRDYFSVLKDHYVILDQKERMELISQQVQEAAGNQGGTAMENDKLLEEITFLVEYPQAFYGEFSESYLDVPQEVLTTSMIEHQRYFPVFDARGRIMAGFIGVRNGTDYYLETVKAGNERVIRARLEDALFFWREDTKKPLENMVPGLSSVLFHERLGTIMDKVDRLKKLAVYIGQATHLSDEMTIVRAAHLCKADLVSSMVYEFPELQGIMGRYYAVESGEPAQVSEAVLEHYLPRFAGDQLPATETGIVLSLAEKLDNLMGCFSIGIRPSGSQDPYALRRQALGIVNIILHTGLSINLPEVMSKAYENFISISPDQSREEAVRDTIDFILQRMRGVLLEKGISYDVIDAVAVEGTADLVKTYERAKSVQNYRQSREFSELMVVFNRSYNLSRKWDSDEVNPDVLIDKSEIYLYQNIILAREEVSAAVSAHQYEQAMNIIAGLRPQVDTFFEAVMVMDKDENLKASRLGLLKSIANMCSLISDFSKIVM